MVDSMTDVMFYISTQNEPEWCCYDANTPNEKNEANQGTAEGEPKQPTLQISFNFFICFLQIKPVFFFVNSSPSPSSSDLNLSKVDNLLNPNDKRQ